MGQKKCFFWLLDVLCLTTNVKLLALQINTGVEDEALRFSLLLKDVGDKTPVGNQKIRKLPFVFCKPHNLRSWIRGFCNAFLRHQPNYVTKKLVLSELAITSKTRLFRENHYTNERTTSYDTQVHYFHTTISDRQERHTFFVKLLVSCDLVCASRYQKKLKKVSIPILLRDTSSL